MAFLHRLVFVGMGADWARIGHSPSSVMREPTPDYTNLQCVDCGRVSRENERGWRAYVTDDEDEPAEALVYCPDCAKREFASD
jgi:hypothetical protein